MTVDRGAHGLGCLVIDEAGLDWLCGVGSMAAGRNGARLQMEYRCLKYPVSLRKGPRDTVREE